MLLTTDACLTLKTFLYSQFIIRLYCYFDARREHLVAKFEEYIQWGEQVLVDRGNQGYGILKGNERLTPTELIGREETNLDGELQHTQMLEKYIEKEPIRTLLRLGLRHQDQGQCHQHLDTDLTVLLCDLWKMLMLQEPLGSAHTINGSWESTYSCTVQQWMIPGAVLLLFQIKAGTSEKLTCLFTFLYARIHIVRQLLRYSMAGSCESIEAMTAWRLLRGTLRLPSMSKEYNRIETWIIDVEVYDILLSRTWTKRVPGNPHYDLGKAQPGYIYNHKEHMDNSDQLSRPNSSSLSASIYGNSVSSRYTAPVRQVSR